MAFSRAACQGPGGTDDFANATWGRKDISVVEIVNYIDYYRQKKAYYNRT